MLPPSFGDSFTVVVLGCANVGKSAFIRRFTHGYFVEEHVTTVEDLYVRTVAVGGKTCELRIWDTPSIDLSIPSRFVLSERHQAHILRADGILLCYSVTDVESFKSAVALYKQIQQVRPGSVPVLFVGNKADPSLADLRHVRQYEKDRVTTQLAVAKESFMETCARQNRGCSNVFFSLARAMLQNQEAQKQLRKELKRSATKDHKRSLSTPSLSMGLQPSATNSCAEIVFDQSALVTRGANPLSLSAAQSPAPPLPPPPPPLHHMRSRSLSRTTTSLRKQHETPRSASIVGGHQRRHTAGTVHFSTGESTSVSSCSGQSADTSSASIEASEPTTPLRSVSSCGNLSGPHRAATLRRMVSMTAANSREGLPVRRSLSARNLADVGAHDRDHDQLPAGLIVQKELERALQGIVTAEQIPQASIPCKNTKGLKSRHTMGGSGSKDSHNHNNSSGHGYHFRSSSMASLDCGLVVALPSTISECATETYGLRRSMELRALGPRTTRRLSDDLEAPVVFPTLREADGVCDTDSAVGSMGSTQSSSPEPDRNSIRTNSSSASNASTGSAAISPVPVMDARAPASTTKFKLPGNNIIKSLRFSKRKPAPVADQAGPAVHL